MAPEFKFSFTLAGERFDDVVVSWIGATEGNTDAGAGYTIDVDVVTRLLDGVARGDATAQQARDVLTTLVAKTCPISGHCPACNESADFYRQALDSFVQAREALEEQISRMTPESHPYVVTGNGTVHVWDCQRSGFGEITHRERR